MKYFIQIPVNDFQHNDEVLREIKTNYEQLHSINLFQIFIVITIFANTFLGILTYLRTLKGPLQNVMTYVTAHSVKQRQYIDFILEELLLVTSSNRAVLGLFHNGTRLGAISFTSMSVFHEAVDANTNSLKSRFKNVPIEKIEEEILKGLNSPHEFIKYSIDQELPPGCLKYLNRNGIHTVYSRVLMNSNKGMYGILEIQYLSQPSNDFLLDKSRINQVELIFSKLTKAIEAIRDNKKFQVDVDSII